ncbi:hypothetical protein [Candidatus Nitrosacidococcus sp. I8]|uniref:hypothetical protein n=1 Tax=Candidatus Nitrosacidococcus sp. I8 TaxID=2942908 RepID=UPI0022277CA1|nr:hypothetical protein [Candidatus Nitrosacidococcus sp. I8]CAH9018654.1 hypothetical protein NURINAE_01054 [Candidatus Nitrosacidococcus sp. I8]
MITNLFKVFLLATWTIGIAVILLFSLKLSEGYLIYTSDAPYIHMSVANNILHGSYGINSGEFSSPSSSILWPWLLTIPEVIGLGTYYPLVLNLIFTAITLIIASNFIVKENIIQNTSIITQMAISILLIICTSSLALPFTGMEHSLHVLLTVAIFTGLVSVSNDKSCWYLIPAIILVPLIRFEGYALSGTAILYLFFTNRRKEAMIAGGLVFTATLVYAIYMVTKDLPILPSSVLYKSEAITALAENAKNSHSIIAQFKENIATIKGNFFLITIGLLFAYSFLMWKDYRNRSLMCIAVAMTITAHLFLGQIIWSSRYEAYCTTISCLSILFLISSHKELECNEISKLVIVALLLLPTITYLKPAFLAPSVSRDIYDQLYQMRRFTLDFYRKPIVANDLGLVSYKNPSYVLDLWGLGLEEARKLRLGNTYDIDAMNQLVVNHHIGLLMIYEHWLKEIPESWVPIAKLSIPKRSYRSNKSSIIFYATPEANQTKLFEDLKEFKDTLPDRVTLEIFNR